MNNPYTIVEPEPEVQWGPMRVKPKNGTVYNYVANTGHVRGMHWNGCSFDLDRFQIGNIFATQATAMHEVERRKVIHELWCQPGARGWYKNQLNCALTFEADEWSAAEFHTWHANFSMPYFNTPAEVLNAINTIGIERLSLPLKG